MCGVFELYPGLLNIRMAAEISAHQATVPGPIVLSITRRMEADVTIARADEPLEGGLLLVVEHFACGAQKDDCFELREVGVIEGRGVFGLLTLKKFCVPSCRIAVIPGGIES